MLLALLAIGLMVVGSIVLSLITWGIAAYADHHRERVRRGELADLSTLYRKDRN